METRAKLINKGFTFDRKLTLTFEVEADPYDIISLEDKTLVLKADVYRQKRSRDANAYFHVLSGKIADKLRISKASAKNMLITRYGQPEMVGDQPMVYKTNAPVEWMNELEYIHSIPCRFEDDAIFYKIYRGSHTYDTYEMSVLIDGTVQEAKALGIETLSPDELARMTAAWKAK